ncbi:MAG: dockerin type I repeat-containing protein [Clostridia bacterium]|nr:dockerin type I repeat-containing protein [Clostridia bacterium]
MKKMVSLLLIVALAACMFALPASADVGYTGYGDTDRNGKVEASDALMVLKCVVGKETIPAVQHCFWDVTADYTVNASDALDILKRVVGKLDVFQAEENYKQFRISAPEAANLCAGDTLLLQYMITAERVNWFVPDAYKELISAQWGTWNSDYITLTIKAGAVDQITSFPLYVNIVEQPAAYVVCMVTIYPPLS